MIELIEDCEHHSEEEIWEACDYRGGVCRFKHQKNCSDYEPVVFQKDEQRGGASR